MDLMGDEREVNLPGFDTGLDVERFRDKTHQFLKAHENDPVIHKLRWNERLGKGDLDTLEKMLVEAGAVGGPGFIWPVRGRQQVMSNVWISLPSPGPQCCTRSIDSRIHSHHT